MPAAAGLINVQTERNARVKASSRRWGGGARVVELSCDHCGEPYTEYKNRASRSVRHYCGRACQIAGRTGEANPHWKGGLVAQECKHCSSAFSVFPVVAAGKSARNPGLFCSLECKGRGLRVHKDRATAKRENRRVRDARRRAGARIASHTPAEWDDLRRLAKYRCLKCGERKPLTRDHIIPLSKGGSDAINNIQPLCHPCNARKNNRVETLL